MTTREMEDAIVSQGKLIEGLERTLADLLNGGRIIAVSEGPATEAARELHGSPAWPTRGRDGEDSSPPEGAILATRNGRCPTCNAAIVADQDLIVKAFGHWQHEECAP
jgi:hypothetical protein